MSEGSHLRQDRHQRDRSGDAVGQTTSRSTGAAVPQNCRHQHHLLSRLGVERQPRF
jgi:hypothetical protein